MRFLGRLQAHADGAALAQQALAVVLETSQRDDDVARRQLLIVADRRERVFDAGEATVLELN
jgi:hypothetical protein